MTKLKTLVKSLCDEYCKVVMEALRKRTHTKNLPRAQNEGSLVQVRVDILMGEREGDCMTYIACALSMIDQLTHYYNVERISPYIDDIHNGS